MKKFILCLSIVLLLSGCGMKENMMVCTKENISNGIRNKVEYIVTYKDDDVKNVKITYKYRKDTDDHIDGMDTGTDGTTKDKNKEDKHEIIDGLLGDKVDDIVGNIYTTILDISGIKEKHSNEINNTKIEGFTSSIEESTNNSYKVIYNIDLNKIKDTDLNRFNINRNYTKIKELYNSQGLTCK